MCDTMVALASVTADGLTLFAKNSDREPNEAHHILHVPAADHQPGSMLKCTYIEIAQVPHTYEVLLAKPFWIWGAEMGANEHGLAIGNEAVFTKVPYEKGPALTGMDLVRLALERAKSAYEAVETVTNLLKRYGQGGNCGFTHHTYYHNSFLLADPSEAWVLETAGTEWAAERVGDIRTISNGLTIGDHWDLASEDLVAYAVDRGWCKGRADFHFARCYSDPLYRRLSRCEERQSRTTELLREQAGGITMYTMFEALRDHGANLPPDWSPARGLFTFSVCAHAGFGPVRASGTTGSLVCHLGEDAQTHFATGTAAPCTSIFKPLWLEANPGWDEPVPGGVYDPATLFWRHEALHRATLEDYASCIALYSSERDALEERFVGEAMRLRTSSAEERAHFSQECFAEADKAEKEWLSRVQRQPIQRRNGWLYRKAWKGFNRQAKMLALD